MDESKHQSNKRLSTGIRSFIAVLKIKVNQKTTAAFHKFQYISLSKSPQVMAFKCAQVRKRLSKLYTLKMRMYWTNFITNLSLLELQKGQKSLTQIKIKDRTLESKVKALRVLTRQWKQKRSQNDYKSKFFTPKQPQTPKMIKEKMAQQFYITLRNIVRNKYLNVFNSVKCSQVTKMKNSKTIYLMNYLMRKRRYWLMYAHERLRLNVLVDRETKSKDEISSLEGRLSPVQDSELQNLKEKQDKLQTALDTVLNQKQQVVAEVDTETTSMQQVLQTKQSQLSQLEEQKFSLLQEIQQRKQQTANYEFTRDEIFYYIYANFLLNLKMWTATESIDQENIFLNKALLLEWLECPVVGFQLDKVALVNQNGLQQVIDHLSALIKEYKRLRANDMPIDWNEVFQQFFSSHSVNQCLNYEDLFSKIKFTSKMLTETIKQNSELMNNMLQSIERSYHKMTEDQTFQVLEC